jgi:hypothetical protein
MWLGSVDGQVAPIRKTHRMPSRSARFDALGRPGLSCLHRGSASKILPARVAHRPTSPLVNCIRLSNAPCFVVAFSGALKL